MGIADRLADRPVHHAAGCCIGKLLAQLDGELPDEAAALRDALAASVDEVGNTAICRALKAEGLLSTSPTTVGYHRNGRCKCDEAGLT